MMESEYLNLQPIPPVEEEVEIEEPKLNIFDLINDISLHGSLISGYLSEHDSPQPEYNAFMINKAFGNYQDTIMITNLINQRYWIPNSAHYAFLYNSLSKRKRFGKWYKQENDIDKMKLLSQYFDCSIKEMRKNVSALTKEQINTILELLIPKNEHKRKAKNGKIQKHEK